MARKTNKDRRDDRKRKLKLRRGFMNKSFEVNLTSMIDMFTIILLFLIKSYAVADVQLSPNKEIKLPSSYSKKIPTIEIKIDISPKVINVDGRPVVYLNRGQVRSSDVQGLVIFPLYRELKTIADERAEKAKMDPKEKFDRQIILFGDKTIPFSTLKRVLFTAGQAQFEAFRFTVIRKATS